MTTALTKQHLKGLIRRQLNSLLPSQQTRRYAKWMSSHLAARKRQYTEAPTRGLLSILTPVWDGSPLRHLQTLARSIEEQNSQGACEWVVLSNGISNEKLIRHLARIEQHIWVKVCRLPQNVGIIAGLRACLEAATGRYVLPVDADDKLYPDALAVVAAHIDRSSFAPLLYTDEDKVIGNQIFDPYLKPDWDPVLLLNSAYIAHLGVMDREKALGLGVYSERGAEGSPDWDAFVRFLNAGYEAVHIPEVVYSWRVHPQSTADDGAAKSYIGSSQKTVLQRALDAKPNGKEFTIEHSPLFSGGAHFRLKWQGGPVQPAISFEIRRDGGVERVREFLAQKAEQAEYIHLREAGLEIAAPDWQTEALGLFRLHDEAVMVGGRIWNRRGEISDADLVFGPGGDVMCPYAGRKLSDPGYFGQLRKQRSVSAVSIRICVVKTDFLIHVLERLPKHSTLLLLRLWLGAEAKRTGKRVIYTPFLAGISESEWPLTLPPHEKILFANEFFDLLPDHRYYSQWFSSGKPFAFE